MKKPQTYFEPTSPVAKLGRFVSRAAKTVTGGMPLELFAGLMLGSAVLAFSGVPLAGVVIGGMIGMGAGLGLRHLAQWAVSPARETDETLPLPVYPITSLPSKEWLSACAAFGPAARRATTTLPAAPAMDKRASNVGGAAILRRIE